MKYYIVAQIENSSSTTTTDGMFLIIFAYKNSRRFLMFT